MNMSLAFVALLTISGWVAQASSNHPTETCQQRVLTALGADYAAETCDRDGPFSPDCLIQKASCEIAEIDKFDDDDNGFQETVIARGVCDASMGSDVVVYNVPFKSFDDDCQFDFYVSSSIED